MVHGAKTQRGWTGWTRRPGVGSRRAGLRVIPWAALALLLPAHAMAGGLGNTPPSVDSITVSPTPIQAGAPATIVCKASDTNGQVTSLQVTVSGGTLPGGTTQDKLVITPGAQVTGSIAWSTPGPGTYDITCTAFDDGGLFGGSAQTDATVQVVVTQPVGSPPVIDKLDASASSVLPGSQVIITAAASDADGDALSFGWQASGGQLSGGGTKVTWTAPAGYGNHTVELTVDDGTGNKTTANLVIRVAWAVASSPIASGVAGPFYPERVAVNPAGQIFVTDSRAGHIAVFGANGLRQRTIAFDGRPAGVAAGADGRLYVGDLRRGRVSVLNGVDKVVGGLGAGDGEFTAPLDIAVAGLTGRVYVADGASGQVKVYSAAGAKLQTLAVAGGMLSGVEVTPSGDAVYAMDSRTGKVHVFNALGAQTGTLGTFGGQAGQISRGAGLAMNAAGDLVVVDAYQSRIVVFKGGQPLDQVGTWGTGSGELRVPLDAVFDLGGRVIVTNTQNGRLEVLTPAGSGAPVCPNDKDCDAMGDAWETSNGLDPADPKDAASDPDADGLTNAQEFQYQTNPQKADTDDDGVTDLAEIEQGKDPNDGTDQGMLAKAGADIETVPAWVTLDGTASRVGGAPPKLWAWTQTAGPVEVTLKNAGTGRPSFAARAAGTYTLALKVGDGSGWSEADEVQVTVSKVAPVADAGPPIGVRRGRWVSLDGRYSHDANGDKLYYTWKQVAGPTVKLQSPWAAAPIFKTKKTGVYAFELVVKDSGGLESAPDRVWVTVNSKKDHVPVAAGPAWSEQKAGTIVGLDASASVDSDDPWGKAPLSFAWKQVAGPTVSLQAADTAKPVFMALEVGLYAFEVRAGDGKHLSVPHRVEVAVRSKACAGACAGVDAGADQRVALGAKVELGCAAPAGVSCAWEQVEGVRVVLKGAGHKRTFVPLESGTYAFKLRASDAFGPGASDVTWVIVDNPAGNLVPVATAELATKVTKIRPGRMVTLRGKDSLDGDPGTKLGYTWTQVQGPAVALLSTYGKNTRMRVPMAGDYAFELRVDDGVDRSPPARVAFTAVKIGQGGGQ